MICVYALAGRGARPVGRGLARERLHLVRVGRVSAIVGSLRRPPAPTPANLKRYDAVVRSLAEQLTSLLPARFGTCFPEPDELRLILTSRQRSFQRALRHVRDRMQMTVRIVGAGEAPPPRASPDPRAPPTSPGRAYLQGRAERAARERELPGFDPVRAAVARWVRDERVDKSRGIATVYHLVPRSSAAAYQRALARAAEQSGLRLVVSGPWPPYAFTEE
jgi:hypothetical protein